MKRHIIKKTLSVLSMLFVAGLSHAQTSTENYVQSITCLDADCIKKIETVQYFDYLGRPKQVVSVKATPQGKDLVTPIVYDELGRATRGYLPVPQSSTSNGNIYPQTSGLVPFPVADATNIYAGEKTYTEKFLENSPLERVLEQKQIGNDWNSKPITFGYDLNNAGDHVKKYDILTTWNPTEKLYTNQLQPVSEYQVAQLIKNTVTDEDGNKTIEFKDGSGQTVLMRKAISTSQNVDTYYVYNEYKQLTYVIPPLASVLVTVSGTTLDNLCYQYKYDNKGRLVEKKLPGKGWEYMVYDKQDRLVLSRDANLEAKGQWSFIKYDQFSRPIYSGILESPPGRIQQQNAVNGKGSNNETRSTASWNNSGIDVFYTANNAYPEMNFKLLTVNYYDTYPNYSFKPSFPGSIINQTVLADNPTTDGKSTKGLPVMSLVKNIEDDNWTKGFNYYDKKGRAIGTYAINHLGGYTKTESELDFAGVTKQTKVYHKRLNTDTEKVITQTYTFDNQNRLLVHKHKIDNNPEEILTQNEYNELSQLKNKKVGGTNAATPLQSIDYTYNIQGWLTKINDPANLGTDLFGYQINYNTVEGLETPNLDFPDLKVKPKYSGNISEVSWKTLTQENDPLKRYGYSYDNLNRLSAGFYQKEGSENKNEYFEKLDYDLNGNILRLKRSEGVLSGSNIAMAIDNLKYDYTGNRLTKVTEEQIGNSNGYPYLATHNTITYDDNGNMTTHLDKGISSIQYNYLNLPKQITQNSKVINTTYRADGVKVKKLFGDIETDYLDGFQYKSTFTWESWNGEGTFNPDPNEIPVIKLRIIPTAEGYYDAFTEQYIYNFTDHLGNVRLSYTDTNKDGIIQPRQYSVRECVGGKLGCRDVWKPGEIVEVNNYYPFGLLHNYTITTLNAYQYKYNGKELQETGFYDYGWRQYMPDIGRWNGMDQLSEKYLSTSPYAYVANNSVRYADIDGRWFAEDGSIINTSGQTYGFLGSSHKPYGATNYLGQGLGDTRGYTPFGETKAYSTLMDALQNNRSFSISNGYMSYWTDGAAGHNSIINGEMEVGATELVGHRVKLSWLDNWYGTGGQVNWFFGTAGVLSGFAGAVQSQSMYSQGIRGGVSGNYQLTGRNLSLFGKMPATKASLPITKMTKIGSAIGKYSFFLGVAFDGIGVINYAINPNLSNAVDPKKAGLNTVMGFIGWKGGAYGAALSTIYFGIDNFYPGGWVGASETATRTEVHEQQMTGHPFFSNSAIKF